MRFEIVLSPRKTWLPFDERGPTGDAWERIPWWKLEGWFYPSDKDSHWGAGAGWLWITLRIGGGGR